MTDLAAALRAEIEAAVAAEVERQLAALPDERSPWLTAPEAAEHLRFPLKRIRVLTAAGAIPFVRQGGRVFYDRHELDRWMRSQADGPPGPARGT